MNQKKKSLSKAQQRALNKLTDEGQCAYRLGESLSTLRSLIRKGFATSQNKEGYLFFPTTEILYKKKE